MDITFIQSQVIFYILNHWQEAPVFQRDIEQVFSLSRSTATGILQQLEEKGLLRRESVESDARLKSLVPTGRAAQLDAEVRACLRQTEEGADPGIVRRGRYSCSRRRWPPWRRTWMTPKRKTPADGALCAPNKFAQEQTL